MPNLYPNPTNMTDFIEFLNFTTSNICIDVSNPATCGAWIFFDLILAIFWLVLFLSFKQRHSLKDSYAGSSFIITILTILLYLMPYNFVRGLELIVVLVNMFISVIGLYLIGD